jgi:hypothetical protein
LECIHHLPYHMDLLYLRDSSQKFSIW